MTMRRLAAHSTGELIGRILSDSGRSSAPPGGAPPPRSARDDAPLAARLSRALAGCHPRRWRQRYAGELPEVPDQHRPTARTVLNLAASARGRGDEDVDGLLLDDGPDPGQAGW